MSKLRGRKKQRPFDRAAFKKTQTDDMTRMQIEWEQLVRAYPNPEDRADYIRRLQVSLEKEKIVNYLQKGVQDEYRTEEQEA